MIGNNLITKQKLRKFSNYFGMVLQRIKQYIDNKGVSIASFERSIGMSNASFGKSLKNNGSIGSDKLENILRVYPDINTDWLLTGNGEMTRLDNSGGSGQDFLTNRLLDKLDQRDVEVNKLILSLSDKDTEIRDLYSRIIDLTSEVERLKAQLDRERESAGVARSSIADAG